MLSSEREPRHASYAQNRTLVVDYMEPKDVSRGPVAAWRTTLDQRLKASLEKRCPFQVRPSAH
jgi:hypothetical protein